MSHEIHADHDQQFLLPPSLDEWVPADHPARFIRDFVGQLDLQGLGFHHREGVSGRPNYSSELLLTVWLYGYLEKVRSARKLEHACRTHMPLIWLSGLHYPDHNTLWRFWRAHRQAIGRVFSQSVQVAQQLGLLGMVVHALDGTKIQVHSSSKKALHRKELEQLKAAIERSIAQMESVLELEGDRERVSHCLPAALEESRHRKRAIQEALSHLDAQETDHFLPSESDARMMMNQGCIEWSYNAQAVVDDAQGVVVAQAVSNDASDQHQLMPMLEAAKADTGASPCHTVADAGYRNTVQQVQAHEAGHVVVVAEQGRDVDDGAPYHKSRFRYDADEDCYQCPEGQKLPYSRTIAAHGGKADARVYRCRHYKDCPVRKQCSRARFGRTIRRDIHETFREQQRSLHAQSKTQALLRRRKAVVEPFFGHIKQNLGIRRWPARGLENARAQWSMLCLTHNLRKIYDHWKNHNEGIPPKSMNTPTLPRRWGQRGHRYRNSNAHWWWESIRTPQQARAIT